MSRPDRRRVVADDYRRQTSPDNVQPQVVLLAGMTSAAWHVARGRGRATRTIRPFRSSATAERDDIHVEGARLRDFTDQGVAHEIAITPPRWATLCNAPSFTVAFADARSGPVRYDSGARASYPRRRKAT